MKIKVSKLKEGYILTEDVKGLSKYPIVPKYTRVDKNLIEVLHAFLVEEVTVTTSGVKKQESLKIEVNTEEEGESALLSLNNVYEEKFLESVDSYKKQFTKWKAGIAISINDIRNCIIPLFDLYLQEPIYLLSIQNYVKERDYIYHKAISVSLIAGYIGKRLGLKKGDYYQIALAGCLSYCGLAKFDQFNPDKSIQENLKISGIKKYPALGYKMLLSIPSLKNDAKLAVLQHKEKIDGSGFPLALEDKKINLFAKVVAIADSYYNLIASEAGVSPFKAIETLMHDYIGKLDLKILQTWIDYITQSAVNLNVKLSNNQIGTIIYLDTNEPTNIIIKLNENETIALKNKKDLTVKEIIINN